MLVLCACCEARVNADEVGFLDYFEGDPEGGGVQARAVFLRCPSCTSPILVRQYWAGSYQDEAGRQCWYSGDERVYPVERTVHKAIPETIRTSLEEALRCLEHRCYVAAAIMCRRTLEALCKHHVGGSKNLATSLKALHDSKVIDDRLYDWAEALRADGNLAAHDPEATFTRQDAQDLADFSEAILEYVFVLSDRFSAFKARRAAAAASKAPKGTGPS